MSDRDMLAVIPKACAVSAIWRSVFLPSDSAV
jgi:hypothetical protein